MFEETFDQKSISIHAIKRLKFGWFKSSLFIIYYLNQNINYDLYRCDYCSKILVIFTCLFYLAPSC